MIVIAAIFLLCFFVGIKLGCSSYLIDLIVSFVAVNVISYHVVGSGCRLKFPLCFIHASSKVLIPIKISNISSGLSIVIIKSIGADLCVILFKHPAKVFYHKLSYPWANLNNRDGQDFLSIVRMRWVASVVIGLDGLFNFDWIGGCHIVFRLVVGVTRGDTQGIREKLLRVKLFLQLFSFIFTFLYLPMEKSCKLLEKRIGFLTRYRVCIGLIAHNL